MQGSYGIWKSMEFDLLYFPGMEKRNAGVWKKKIVFPDFCPYLVFFFFL